MNALGERGAPGQVRGVIGAVGCRAPRSRRSCGCRDRGSGTNRTIVLARSRAGTSHPSTRHRPAGWRHAWLAGETGAVAWRVPGGSSGHARATPGGSWIRWRYRRFRQPASERSWRAGSRRSAARSRLQRYVPALPRSGHARGAAGSRPAAGRRVSDHRSSASVGWCADRCPPERRQEPAWHRWLGPRRLGQSRSGDLPGGSCVLAFVEDRLEFF